MLEKLQDYLTKYMHKDYSYLIVTFIYLLSVYIPLLIIGYMFNMIPFVIISVTLMSIIRNYSGGFHCTSNGRCLFLSSILTIIFGYIAKQTVDSLQFAFFISVLSIRDLYLKAPLFIEDVPLDKRWYNCRPFSLLKINTTKYDKPYDKVWYRKGMIRWIVISLFFSVILLYFEQYYYTSCVLWSIIICDALLFKNQDEFI